MNLKNIALVGAALLFSSPVFASTYYGGFEDWKGGDADYNDIVFSMSGDSLKLLSSGTFYAKPAIDNNGTPFWDNHSADGGNKNIGFCIYGGGDCGAAISPNAMFLAGNPNSQLGSANDVTFSVNGNVSASVILQITAASDQLGYYLTSDPNTVHALTPVTGSTYSFTPTGNFGLVGIVNNSTYYYSQTQYGASDNVSHFAFFTPAPEPGMLGLVGAGLVSVGAFFRRKKAVAQIS